jgi:hypothetical protein
MATGQAVVDRWVRATKQRQLVVLQTAAQSLFEEANMSRFKGGKMPIDVGFLKASFDASPNGMPSGPGRFDGGALPDNSGNVSAVVSNMRVGDVIFAGWTAVYARRQEYEHYGFARSAVDNWQTHVNNAVAVAKAAVP